MIKLIVCDMDGTLLNQEKRKQKRRKTGGKK